MNFGASNFGALPPEVNSVLMYTGPGSGPLLAAATAWEAMAAELSSNARSCQAVLSALTDGPWQGPTATAAAVAAAPYAAWLSSTGAQAAQTAAQVRSVAGAYEATFTATVPPWVVIANRGLLMSLIATNILGQNSTAIAATEAQYAEMWAQDSAAMNGYATAVHSAGQLTPFAAPPHVTNAVTPSPTAAAQQPFPALAGPTFQGIIDDIFGPLSPGTWGPIAAVPYLLALQNVLLPMQGNTVFVSMSKIAKLGLLGEEILPVTGPGPATLLSTGSAAPAVTAGTGRADAVNGLSVPRNWTDSAPGVRTFASALPTPSSAGVAAPAPDSANRVFGAAAAGTLTGRALGATGGAASRTVGRVGTAAAGAANLPTTTIVVIPEDDPEDDQPTGRRY